MGLTVPFAHQHSARSQISSALLEIGRGLPNIGRRSRTIEQAAYIGVEVAQMISLKPIRQNAKQQMAGEVRGRVPPKDSVPSGLKSPDIETAQSRDLDMKLLSIRQGRTNCHARHDGQAERRPGRRDLGGALPAPTIR